MRTADPPSRGGEFVPGFGLVAWSQPRRYMVADHVTALHGPRESLLSLRWGFLPTINDHRHCRWCGAPWTCLPALWARTVLHPSTHQPRSRAVLRWLESQH